MITKITPKNIKAWLRDTNVIVFSTGRGDERTHVVDIDFTEWEHTKHPTRNIANYMNSFLDENTTSWSIRKVE